MRFHLRSTIRHIAPFIMAPLISTLAATAPAQAQTETWHSATGVIQHTTFSAAHNSAFRVFLQNNGATLLNDCTYNFAYLNTSDDNYQAKVSGLLLAFSQSKLVQMSYVIEPSGFCRITDFQI